MAPRYACRFAPVSGPPPSESPYFVRDPPYFVRDPPSDLHSYQRSLFLHTLKQAEASSALPAQVMHNGPRLKTQKPKTDSHYCEEYTEHIEHAA